MDMKAFHERTSARGGSFGTQKKGWRTCETSRTRHAGAGSFRRWKRGSGCTLQADGKKFLDTPGAVDGVLCRGVAKEDQEDVQTNAWSVETSSMADERVPARPRSEGEREGPETDDETDTIRRKRRKKKRPSPKSARKRRRRQLLRDARAIVEERLLALLDEKGGEATLRVLLEEYRLAYGSALRFADDYGVEDAKELLRTLPRTYPKGRPGNALVARAPETDSLRERLVVLMQKHRCIRISELNQMYARLYGEPLRLQDHGLERIVDLAEAFPDIVTLESLVHEQGRKRGRAYKVLRIRPQASEKRIRKRKGTHRKNEGLLGASAENSRIARKEKESSQVH